MAINPSQRCHRAVIPNERLSNAIEQKIKSVKLLRKEKEVKVEKGGEKTEPGGSSGKMTATRASCAAQSSE